MSSCPPAGSGRRGPGGIGIGASGARACIERDEPASYFPTTTPSEKHINATTRNMQIAMINWPDVNSDASFPGVRGDLALLGSSMFDRFLFPFRAGRVFEGVKSLHQHPPSRLQLLVRKVGITDLDRPIADPIRKKN